MEKNEDVCAVQIVDYDWAGEIGEATYPPNINTKTVRRAQGVSRRAADHRIII